MTGIKVSKEFHLVVSLDDENRGRLDTKLQNAKLGELRLLSVVDWYNMEQYQYELKLVKSKTLSPFSNETEL